MVVAPKWYSYPAIEGRRTVLWEARNALSEMAFGRSPTGLSSIEPSPELSQVAYRLATKVIDRALAEVTRAAHASTGQDGGAKLADEPLQVFQALNRVPALRLLGVWARKRAEEREAGEKR